MREGLYSRPMSAFDRDGLHVGRFLFLGLLLWWTFRLTLGGSDQIFLDLVNLAFHEAGHLFLTPLGQTAHFLGGSLFQVGVPSLLVGYFLVRRPNPPAAAFCAWWVGESLVDVSIYMADARTLQLNLVGGGMHDWNEIFYRFGLLDAPSVARVSGATRLLGVLVMLLGLAWWTCFVVPDATRHRWRDRLAERWPAAELLLD